MNKDLMKYIPKEYKALVEDITAAKEKEYNEITKKWDYIIIVDWKNGERTYFQNKSFMRTHLKEFHFPSDFGG